MTRYHQVCLIIPVFPFRINGLVCDAATVGTLNSVIRGYHLHHDHITYKHKYDGRTMSGADTDVKLYSEPEQNIEMPAKDVWRVHIEDKYWKGRESIRSSLSERQPILDHSVSPRSQSSAESSATYPRDAQVERWHLRPAS